MAPRPPKPCRKAGCNALSRDANGFCPAHQEYAATLEEQRQKRGDERRESACKRGYGRHWEKVRAAQLRRHPLCFVCEKNGFAAAANTVHHIDENQHNNAPENLMSLHHECHERLHGRIK